MTIPAINETPEYVTKIPSTGQEIKYRPFVMKEQKVLLIALESADTTQIIGAINNILSSCVSGLNIKSLTTFDLEYLFLQLRGKSVGENINTELRCYKCKEFNKISFNIDDVKIDIDPKKIKQKIELNENYSVLLKYPSYDYVMKASNGITTETEMLYVTVLGSLDKLFTKDEVIDLSIEPMEELETFLDSMNTKQFDAIAEKVGEIPKLKHTIEFDCEKCEHHNKIKLEGINDFFL